MPDPTAAMPDPATTEKDSRIEPPDDPELVKLGSLGQHVIWGDRPKEPLWIVLKNLGAVVIADGANGLTRESEARAFQLGIYVEPGASSAPLAAYHPSDWGPRSSWRPAGRAPYGLDAPENGGSSPETGYGWLVRDGRAYIQPPGAPAPGFYVSQTALVDGRYRDTDPRRYFDAAALPGFVLPGRDLDPYRVHLGDLALVEYNGRRIWAQAFDVGPPGRMVELSIAACFALGIPDCARSGGTEEGVDITILPGSRKWFGGPPRPESLDEINRAGRAAARGVGLRIGPG